MTFDDLQTGDIFTIDNTPSYPKLKTDYGYIDMRDGIKIQSAMLNRKLSIRLMSFQDIIDQSGGWVTDNKMVKQWCDRLKKL